MHSAPRLQRLARSTPVRPESRQLRGYTDGWPVASGRSCGGQAFRRALQQVWRRAAGCARARTLRLRPARQRTQRPTRPSPPQQARAAMTRVLVSNDDGIDAPGLRALAAALCARPGLEVNVCAPREEQSGKSHAITLARFLSCHPRHGDIAGAAAAYAVDGAARACTRPRASAGVSRLRPPTPPHCWPPAPRARRHARRLCDARAQRARVQGGRSTRGACRPHRSPPRRAAPPTAQPPHRSTPHPPAVPRTPSLTWWSQASTAATTAGCT